jgi:hypothetical protein
MHLDDVPKEKKYSKRDSQKAEKRFLQEMKKIKSRHTEYTVMVDNAQNSVPFAIHHTGQMYSLMEKMSKAHDLSEKVQSHAYTAFRQLQRVPRKKSYELVRKHLSMGIIQTHRLTRLDVVMRGFIQIRKWMKENGIKPRKKGRKPAKKK